MSRSFSSISYNLGAKNTTQRALSLAESLILLSIKNRRVVHINKTGQQSTKNGRRAQEAHTTILERLEVGRGRDNKAMIANIHRIAAQPVVRYRAPAIPVVEAAEEEAAGNNGRVVFAATLSANP